MNLDNVLPWRQSLESAVPEAQKSADAADAAPGFAVSLEDVVAICSPRASNCVRSSLSRC